MKSGTYSLQRQIFAALDGNLKLSRIDYNNLGEENLIRAKQYSN